LKVLGKVAAPASEIENLDEQAEEYLVINEERGVVY
jgi:hypothetical protein